MRSSSGDRAGRGTPAASDRPRPHRRSTQVVHDAAGTDDSPESSTLGSRPIPFHRTPPRFTSPFLGFEIYGDAVARLARFGIAPRPGASSPWRGGGQSSGIARSALAPSWPTRARPPCATASKPRSSSGRSSGPSPRASCTSTTRTTSRTTRRARTWSGSCAGGSAAHPRACATATVRAAYRAWVVVRPLAPSRHPVVPRGHHRAYGPQHELQRHGQADGA